MLGEALFFEVRGMSLFSEIKKYNFLFYALEGTRDLIARELELPNITVATSETHRLALLRKAAQEGVSNPLAHLVLSSIAGDRDSQNNYAMRRNGLSMIDQHSRALTKKAYIYKVIVGLDFHYIHSDPLEVLAITQTLGILSATSGFRFNIDVGDSLTLGVYCEIPKDYSINVAENSNPSYPGATEVVASMVLNTQIGFLRDVAAVNGYGINTEYVVTMHEGDPNV